MGEYKNFKAIKYMNPTWYFNLYPENELKYSTGYFNSEEMNLSEEAKNFLPSDSRYISKAASDLDTGYRLWNKGYLLYVNGKSPESFFHKNGLTKVDNYIFIRKYYGRKFLYYFLFRNLIQFSNPYGEIKALMKTKSVKKENLPNPHFEYPEYEDYDSRLLNEKPLVSVVIPTLGRYEYLKDVMKDLQKQSYGNIEIIISDQNDNPDKEFYEKFNLNIKVIYQKGKGQWLARNEAIKISRGEFILFFDDDSRVDQDWIKHHIKCLDFFKADISAGVSISLVGDKVPENYSYFRWADQFDSGNAMVRREVFLKTGLFDRQFDRQRMGDGEFGLRAYLSGFRSVSNPYAKRVHLKVGSGGLRQMGSWDAFRPKNFFAPRPVPSVLYFFRKYFPAENVINALILRLAPSLIPYKWKGKKILYPFSFIAALLIFPLLMIQLSISWSKSTSMLREGEKIERL